MGEAEIEFVCSKKLDIVFYVFENQPIKNFNVPLK